MILQSREFIILQTEENMMVCVASSVSGRLDLEDGFCDRFRSHEPDHGPEAVVLG